MIFCLIAAVLTHAQAKGVAAITTPQIAEAIAWLPADTMDVNVAAEPGKTVDEKEPGKIGDMVFALAQIAMLPDKDFMPWAMSYEFIVQGIRNVRAPKDYGLFPFDGCTIVDLQSQEEERLKSLIAKKFRHAVVDGRETYVFQQDSNKDIWKFYVTFDGPLMFCATDKVYLSEVFTRRTRGSSAKQSSCLPDDLPFLKYIEPGAPFWGIGKYPPVGQKLPSGVTVDKSFPVGFAVWLPKDRGKVNVIKIMNLENTIDRTKQMWLGFLDEDHEKAEFKAIDSHTTLSSIDGKAEMGQMFFLLGGLLGHPVEM